MIAMIRRPKLQFCWNRTLYRLNDHSHSNKLRRKQKCKPFWFYGNEDRIHFCNRSSGICRNHCRISCRRWAQKLNYSLWDSPQMHSNMHHILRKPLLRLYCTLREAKKRRLFALLKLALFIALILFSIDHQNNIEWKILTGI